MAESSDATATSSETPEFPWSAYAGTAMAAPLNNNRVDKLKTNRLALFMMVLFYHDIIESIPICQIEVLGPQITADASFLQEFIGLVLLYT